MLGPAADAGLPERLRQYGCHSDLGWVSMVATLAEVDHEHSEEIVEVSSPAGNRGAPTATGLDHLDPGEARLLTAAGPPVRHFALPGKGAVTTFTAGTIGLGLHLFVQPDHRRRGVGRKLVRHALAVAADAGCTHVALDPTAATVPFYERIGFTLEPLPDDRAFHVPCD